LEEKFYYHAIMVHSSDGGKSGAVQARWIRADGGYGVRERQASPWAHDDCVDDPPAPLLPALCAPLSSRTQSTRTARLLPLPGAAPHFGFAARAEGFRPLGF
jgi:hypothetical protein